MQFLSQISEYSPRKPYFKIEVFVLPTRVTMETMGCHDIKSVQISAAVDVAGLSQVSLRLAHSKMNDQYLLGYSEVMSFANNFCFLSWL